MKKGDYIEGTIEKVIFPAKGILSVDGVSVVIKNTLPGQKVSAVINKKRSGKCEARLLSVTEESEHEEESLKCPYHRVCGGCAYENVNYDFQLEMKSSQVKALIDGVCSDYTFEGIIGSPESKYYRNKVELSFGDEVKDGPLALGMHKFGSFHDIVTVYGCHIMDSDFSEILKSTCEYFSRLSIPFYHKMQHTGYLRHLVIRKAKKTGEILVVLVTTTQGDIDDRAFADMLLSAQYEGKLVGILHTFNDSLSDAVINERTELIYGKDYIYEELLGLKFKISPFSFFQTNSLGAEKLYSVVREYAGDVSGKTIFDLYSGTGTIAQILAPVAKEVVGVEIVEEAVLAARENALLNGLSNCTFIAGDVLKEVEKLEQKPDLIILDPPRDGIHPKAIGKIIDFGVEKIVYVSCKPTSLARDIEIFEARGYKVEKVKCVDMFPGTGHVETVVLLQRKDM